MFCVDDDDRDDGGDDDLMITKKKGECFSTTGGIMRKRRRFRENIVLLSRLSKQKMSLVKPKALSIRDLFERLSRKSLKGKPT